jgi:hypothetical protein
MDTIILRGNSEESSKLILQLAKQLKFKAKKLSAEETEDLGIAISIQEGIESGLLTNKEKLDFLLELDNP